MRRTVHPELKILWVIGKVNRISWPLFSTDEPKENGDVLKCECTSNHASPTGLGKWTLDGVSRYVFSVLYVSKVFKYLCIFI